MINTCLRNCKPIVDNLPPSLQLSTNPVPEIASFEYVLLKFPERQLSNDMQDITPRDAIQRRSLQFEIQKANIYASHLATRAYYVEKYFNLRDAYTASK